MDSISTNKVATGVYHNIKKQLTPSIAKIINQKNSREGFNQKYHSKNQQL